MNKFEYKNLTPFKWFALENFPFIEADFDAITEWQLLCKLGKEINKIINSTNTLGTQVESLTDYVTNYFDNLDVQEEINNKLNEMAESGQLTDIIAQYLQLAGLLCFNTKSDMKNAENLVNGSFAKTYGTSAYNDGYGEFYKIRTLLNTDVIDENNIIALTNYPTLIAEKIPNAYINFLNNKINNLQRLVNKKYIFIGDSYNTDTAEIPWAQIVRNSMGLTDDVNCFRSGVDGAGWVHNQGHTFLDQLQTLASNITDKNSITDIIVCGGVNDVSESLNDVYDAINDFATYVKTNFPNALIHVGMISWVKGDTGRSQLRNILNYYNNSSIHNSNMVSITNAFTYYHNYGNFQEDGHPTSLGSYEIGGNIANYLKGGVSDVKYTSILTYTGNAASLITDTDNVFIINNTINGNNVDLKIEPQKSYLTSGVDSMSTDIPYKIAQTTESNQFFWFNDSLTSGIIQTGTAYIQDNNNVYHELKYRLSSYKKELYLYFSGVNSSGTIRISNPRKITLIPNNFTTSLSALYS